MRVGGHSRFKGLMLMLILLPGLFYPYYRAQAAFPLLVARAVIPVILGRVIMKRAMQVAANDAVYLSLVRNTTRAVSATTRTNAVSVGSKSFFRSAGGALTWAGVGYTAGDISSDYFSGKGDIMIATSGKSVGNGKYEVEIDGKTYITDFMPSESNPFIAVPVTGENNNSRIVPELTSAMQWYQTIHTEPKQYITGSVESVARGYFNYGAERGGYDCPAGKGQCSYEFIPTKISVNQVYGSTVSYNFIARYTNKNGEEAERRYYPIQDIQVYYNKNYIPDNNAEDKEYMIAGDEDGFSALEKLKEYQLDLDKLASVINNLLYQSATQPDYDGVPVTSSDPVTADEIRAVYPEHGKLTDFDLLYPAQVSPGGDLVINTPGISGGAENTGKVEIELGDYPDVAEPELDEPPTGKEILAPLENLFPFVRNMQLPSKEAACPVAEFSVLDTSYRLDSHCPLLEQNRKLFQLMAGIIWAFLSLRIILSA